MSAPPSFAPTRTPTNTHAPTPTLAPTNTAAPTASWTSITLPLQPNSYGGYSYLAMNNGATFIVALPTTGPAAFYSINSTTGLTQIKSFGNSYYDWTSVAMTYDGSIVCYIQSGTLMYSLDMTTNLQQATINNQYNQYYQQVAISGDGTTVIISADSYMTTQPVALYVRSNASAPFNPVLHTVSAISQFPAFGYLAGVAASYDGQTLSILLTTSLLYLSTNQGVTWNFQSPITVPTTPCSYWFMSAYYNGSDMIALNGNDDYGIQSTNTGKSWKSLKELPKTTLYTIAGSDSGEYLVLSTYDGIYLSSNAGANWTYSSPIGQGANNRGIVASDPTGMYVAAITTTSNKLYLYTVPNIPTPTPSSAPTLAPTYSFAPTQTLSPSLTPTYIPSFKPTAIPSLLPTIQIEQYFFLQSFAQTHIYFQGMAMDNNGFIGITQADAQFYITIDSGYSWFISQSSDFVDTYYNVKLVSGNGVYVYVICGSLYVTSNTSSYTQWQPLPTGTIVNAAVSYTGQYIVIAPTASSLRLSSDYGKTFTTLPIISALNVVSNPINQLSIDNTGAHISIISTLGYVYVSSNSGQSFTTNTLSAPPTSSSPVFYVLSTSTGLQNQYQYAFNTRLPTIMYKSTASGSQWYNLTVNTQATPVSNAYISMDCSSNGQYVVMAYNNYVY